ncbi:MAG: BCCT family transporter [Deltaproteobacteria bacterium]|nr:BCCT family transporter [Deltaproteobacteria bacterium]
MRWLDSRIDRRVFWGAALLVLPFLLAGALAPEATGGAANRVLQAVTTHLGGVYLGLVSLFVGAGLALALSPLGRIRLGRDDEPPEFSRTSWFAMLFSAGMGIGLVFWSIAEPMIHFTSPPTGPAGTAEAARLAFEIFFFHWGVHAWGTYVVVGLAIAYFHFRKGEPALVSRCLAPLIGRRRAEGWPGVVVDVLAIWATVMGVVTSLGLGALQITSGLHLSAGLPDGVGTTLAVIGVITLLFIASAVSGVSRGIKLLSNLNVLLMLTLLGFFLAYGPTRAIAATFGRALADYLRDIVPLSTSTVLFGNPEWTRAWTVFYWAWWVAWAPFVGAFIARISRGRTVREFVIGVMVLPALFSFAFASALGGTAVHLDPAQGGAIARMVQTVVESALFGTLRQLPHYGLLAALANLLIASFFITSADSATYVVSTFSTGGAERASRRLIVFWGATLGAVAAVLVYAGGLNALQTASIVGSLPFLAVMVLLLAATVRDMWEEIRTSPPNP